MRVVIFDIGNVLVRYDHTRTLEAVAELCSVTPGQLADTFNEVGRAFGLGEITPEQFCDHIRTRTAASSLSCDLIEDALCTGMSRDDAALHYVQTLLQLPDVEAGAISNTNATHVGWLDTHVPELASFELVLMSNEVGLLKPDPEIFELALELLDVAPAHVLYIDDLEVNVQAAQAVGMAGIVHCDWETTRPQIETWLDIPAGGDGVL